MLSASLDQKSTAFNVGGGTRDGSTPGDETAKGKGTHEEAEVGRAFRI
jgi:hypothetical protein